jgi:hypothetical protein
LVVANSQNRDFGTPDPVALEIVRKNKERKAASAAKQWAEVMRERSDLGGSSIRTLTLMTSSRCRDMKVQGVRIRIRL